MPCSYTRRKVDMDGVCLKALGGAEDINSRANSFRCFASFLEFIFKKIRKNESPHKKYNENPRTHLVWPKSTKKFLCFPRMKNTSKALSRKRNRRKYIAEREESWNMECLLMD
jgi:hypothetical protein